jgi:NAD(P)-dependent dehydrogenase (short-subunit alcohol dehydrogenase family)
MKLDGKKALVTGASLGIGRAIALAYAREGADVAVTGRNAETLTPVAEEIRGSGRKAHIMEWDVSDVTQAPARIDEARTALGGLDVLVNNAGVLRRDGSRFPDLTPEEWDYVLNTNLKGLYFACQAADKAMREKGGVIINIASDAGLRGETQPYGLSKWGVVGLTKGMGRACAGRGIRVNAIAPGPVATRMMGWEPGKPLDREGVPLQRLARPEEVAAVAVFLASEDSAGMFGQIVVVNSGTAF